ncbi:hypothetical protein JHK87_048105 [Glycine soja]|nr:hypothetical protein JHK87_048105 [Glycine soja]
MEAEILKALKFELGGPIVKTFLRFQRDWLCIKQSLKGSRGRNLGPREQLAKCLRRLRKMG